MSESILMWAKCGADSPIMQEFKARGGRVKSTTSGGQEAFLLTLPPGWSIAHKQQTCGTDHPLVDKDGQNVGVLIVGDPGHTRCPYQALYLDGPK